MRSAILCLGFSLFGSSVVFGQVSTWDGGINGNGSSWNIGGNWVSESTPSTGDNLIFNNRNGTGTIASPMSVSSTRTVGSITFDNVNSKLPAILRIDTNGSGSNSRTLTINTGITTTNYAGGNVTFNENNFGRLTIALGSPDITIDTQSTSSININCVMTETTAGRGITKTGTGYLVLASANTFSGSVIVNGGSLISSNLSGSGTGTGAITVNSGGTLGGFGTVSGATTVNFGGTIRGDSINGTSTLTTGNVTINSGGSIFSNLDASATNSMLALGANTLDLKTGSILKLDNVGSYAGAASNTWIIAQLTSGTTLRLDGNVVADGFQFGSYSQGTGSIGPVQIDVSSLPTLDAGLQFQLKRSENNLVLTITPVPEPALMLGLAAGLMGIGAALRKKFFAPATAA